jgi:hypothetical protein
MDIENSSKFEALAIVSPKNSVIKVTQHRTRDEPHRLAHIFESLYKSDQKKRFRCTRESLAK